MGQNLGQRKTQTVTHTPIGHNGEDSMGRLFMGTHPVSSVRNTTLCWRCGTPDRIGPTAGASQMTGEKDVGDADHACRGSSVWVFYLFYLRLVLLPHHLVKGAPSSRWWAERNETGRSSQGIPICSCLFTFPPFLIIPVHISA